MAKLSRCKSFVPVFNTHCEKRLHDVGQLYSAAAGILSLWRALSLFS